MSRIALVAAAVLCAIAPRSAAAEPHRMTDGTVADRWTLPNGLEVVTRDVPGAHAASISWGYRIGSDHDPADRPGFAALLAEVHFTAEAADVPARSREEMESLRPTGSGTRVNRRQTLFTENATAAQLPGVIRQVATRMRGVRVTDATLATALASVKRMLGEKAFGSPDQMLASQVRDYAAGLDAARIVDAASGRALEKVRPGEVAQALERTYVAANGVVAIVGDLSGLDLHSIVASEFGGLPAGRRLPDPPPARFVPAAVVVERAEVAKPVGTLALFAPALTDSLHPSFFLSMLGLGAFARGQWGGRSPFQYALLDDPDLVRFRPPVPDTTRSPATVAASFAGTVAMLMEGIQTVDVLREYYDASQWLMGGPVPKNLLQQIQVDGTFLNVFSASLASQALWGSPEFWDRYRHRCDPEHARRLGSFVNDILESRHQAVLLLVPRP